jgi:hypothetical protein
MKLILKFVKISIIIIDSNIMTMNIYIEREDVLCLEKSQLLQTAT